MDPYRVQVEVHYPITKAARLETEPFLVERGLDPERDVELMVLVRYDGRIAASASLWGNIIKEVAVDPLLEGEGLAAVAISRIITEAHDRNRSPLRVFTAPKNQIVFESFGFALLASSENGRSRTNGSASGAILMESDRRNFYRWVDSTIAELSRQGHPGFLPRSGTASGSADFVAPSPTDFGPHKKHSVASVVVNCNPFTLGHRSLIERASARCGTLVVFVLEADKSSFPAAVRLDLVRQGTADIPNVAVIPSGPYLISEATFPTYFLKEKSRATEVHARLDVQLFGTRIAPSLGITARFMGTEPYCPVTNRYNTLMKELLPPLGIETVELPRAETAGKAISASSVREALRTGDWQTLETLVPKTTLRYLRSPEAAELIKKISAGPTRH
jgi:[citrate (pro-3S)-lyase] ligase